MFTKRLYIQIGRERVRISSPDSDRTYDAPPLVAIGSRNGRPQIEAIGEDARSLQSTKGITVVNPFGHPRVLVGDFTVAEKLMQHAVRYCLHGRWIIPAAEAIVHPEGKFDGGLTQIELRALRELMVNAGCRKVTIYEGRPLTDEEIRRFDFRENEARS